MASAFRSSTIAPGKSRVSISAVAHQQMALGRFAGAEDPIEIDLRSLALARAEQGGTEHVTEPQIVGELRLARREQVDHLLELSALQQRVSQEQRGRRVVGAGRDHAPGTPQPLPANARPCSRPARG